MRIFTLSVALALLVPAACTQADAPGETTSDQDILSLNAAAVADPRRVLDLEGGVNFRDLGGYLTQDGRVVKWETVYRSGSPARLTEADFDELSRRGIRTFCDFRDRAEREGEPNTFVQGNDEVTYWTRDYEQGMSDLNEMLTGPDAGPETSRAALLAVYKTIPEEHALGFSQMFRFLAEGQVPLAFNCAAGKDRTGVGAALLLTLLGVPRATVVADYALSDDIVDYRVQMQESAANNPAYAFLLDLPWETVEPLLASDPAYIESAFAALEEKYGSVDAFIENELGVTADMKQQIKAHLTKEA